MSIELPELPSVSLKFSGNPDHWLQYQRQLAAYWEARARKMVEALQLIAGTNGTESAHPRGRAALALDAIGPLPPEQP